jgi:hypothetical protein
MLEKEPLPAESFFTSYLVRIYRFKKEKPWSLVGLVEETGIKGKKAFTNYDELWEILNNPQKGKAQRKRRPQAKSKVANPERRE